MKHLVFALTFCITLLTTMAAHAQLAQVRSIEGVTEYALPNGLQVLLVPDASKPVATVNITYRVGSRHESTGETGSAHLLEHMLFKASGKVTNAMLDMQSLGMRWNGTTNFDRTNYFAHFLTNDDKATERMDYMLGWLAGMMTQAKFTRADLDSEMTVVRNEFERAENEPGRVLGDRMRAAAFSYHGYRHSVLGAKSDIENMPLEALYAFYRKHYRPDNATLIIAGRFDETAVKAKITAEFGTIAKPAAPLPTTYSIDPVQDGERSVMLRRAGGLASTAVLYRMPAGGTQQGLAARVLAQALQQANGPLTRGLVNQRLAVTEWAYYAATREPGFLMVGIGLPEKADGSSDDDYRIKAISSAAALAKVLEIYQPSDAEISNARNTLLARVRAALRDAEATGQLLSEMVAMGDWQQMFYQRDALETLSADEVRQLARSYLVANNRTSGTYLPYPATNEMPAPAAATLRAPALSIPTATQFVAARAVNTWTIANISTQNSNPNSNPSSTLSPVVKADSFDITPAVLAQRTERAQLTVAGAPGLKLALLPRATKGDRVTGTLRLRWGTAESVKGSGAIAPMLAVLLMEDNARLSGSAFREKLQALDAQFNLSSFPGFLNVNLEFPAANTTAVLEQLNFMLRAPKFNLQAFERNQRAMLATMQNLKSSTVGLAGNVLDRSYRPKSTYSNGDPREARSFEESETLIRQAKVDELTAYWERFGSAQVGELVLMGPIALAPVQSQLQALWGDWASTEPHSPWATAYTAPEGEASVNLALAEKANANYAARIAIKLNEADADFPALFTAVQLLSQQGLRQRVRVKEGLSYGVDASLNVPTEKSTDAAIAISASFAPANLAKLRSTIREVLVEARSNGYSGLEVSFAKSAILSRRIELRNQPANIVSGIASNLRYERPLDYAAIFDKAYEALDASAVNLALKKYLEVERLRDVAVGSF
jgi:zinc protease